MPDIRFHFLNTTNSQSHPRAIFKQFLWQKRCTGNWERVRQILPVNIYLLKANCRNAQKRCEMCLKLTIKTPERLLWHRYCVFIVNFEHILHFDLVVFIVVVEQVDACWVCSVTADRQQSSLFCSKIIYYPKFIIRGHPFMTSTKSDQFFGPHSHHPQKWTIDRFSKTRESANTWQISRPPPSVWTS